MRERHSTNTKKLQENTRKPLTFRGFFSIIDFVNFRICVEKQDQSFRRSVFKNDDEKLFAEADRNDLAGIAQNC